jgi:CubicO group peptidase (beta-lactamase class C family)
MKPIISVAAALFLAVPCVELIPCADAEETSEIVWPTKGWPSSTPEEEGMDSVALAKLVDAVGARRQDSLLIARHGKIVAEAYYAPYEAGVRHDLRSVTKSFIGTLTAIAIQDGFLNSVDDRIVDLFSDKQIANIDRRKKDMTDLRPSLERRAPHARRDDCPDVPGARSHEIRARSADVGDAWHNVLLQWR